MDMATLTHKSRTVPPLPVCGFLQQPGQVVLGVCSTATKKKTVLNSALPIQNACLSSVQEHLHSKNQAKSYKDMILDCLEFKNKTVFLCHSGDTVVAA